MRDIIKIAHGHGQGQDGILRNPSITQVFEQLVVAVKVEIPPEEIQHKCSRNQNGQDQQIGSFVDEMLERESIPLEIEPNPVDVDDIERQEQGIQDNEEKDACAELVFQGIGRKWEGPAFALTQKLVDGLGIRLHDPLGAYAQINEVAEIETQ